MLPGSDKTSGTKRWTAAALAAAFSMVNQSTRRRSTQTFVCQMKLRFRFTILTLIALTTVVAHTGAKRFAARRLATSSGKVQSTWIPFVIQVGVPEQQPRTFGSITANAITMRRYAGICGMYFLVASYVEMDMSKPFQNSIAWLPRRQHRAQFHFETSVTLQTHEPSNAPQSRTVLCCMVNHSPRRGDW